MRDKRRRLIGYFVFNVNLNDDASARIVVHSKLQK